MKKTLAVLLSALLLFSLFTGCAEDDPYADLPETPAEMFEYEENEDGGITITKYIGEDPEVKIPKRMYGKKVTKVGAMAFADTNLSSVIVPGCVKTIDIYAFARCTRLESVVLEKGLVEIAAGAFDEDSRLTEIVIPETVMFVLDDSFDGCSALEAIKFEGDAPEEFLFEFTLEGEYHRAEPENVHFTVYYHEGAKGFTSPEWEGYPTEIW